MEQIYETALIVDVNVKLNRIYVEVIDKEGKRPESCSLEIANIMRALTQFALRSFNEIVELHPEYKEGYYVEAEIKITPKT